MFVYNHCMIKTQISVYC